MKNLILILLLSTMAFGQSQILLLMEDDISSYFFTFHNDDEKLFLYYSYNDTIFYSNSNNPLYTDVSGVRDPSITKINGTYYMVYTCVKAANGYVSGQQFGYASSPDMINWTSLTKLSTSPITGNYVWAPQFYQEEGDDSVYIFVSIASVSWNNKIYILGASKSNMVWTQPRLVYDLSSLGQVGVIDPFIIKVGSTYYLWYKYQTSAWTSQYLEVATSNSLKSGYTRVKTGNWATFGNYCEGASVVLINDTTYRVYYEDFKDENNRLKYADSYDNMGTFTTPKLLYNNVNAVLKPGEFIFPDKPFYWWFK